MDPLHKLAIFGIVGFFLCMGVVIVIIIRQQP